MTACSVQTTKTGWKVAYRQDGRQRSRSFQTRRDADRWATVVRAAGVDEALRLLADEPDDRVVLLSEALELHLAERILKPGTLTEYRRVAARSWLPTLGPLPVHGIGKDTVVRWVRHAHEVEGKSPKTVSNAHGLLSGVLQTCVENGHITGNPCRGVRMPTGERREKVWLTEAQGVALILALPEWYRPLVVVIAATGMRIGEVTALQWRDVDTAAGVVWVRRGWHKDGGTYVLSSPKTKRSVRPVPLPPVALAALQAVHDRQPSPPAPGDTIFRGPQGGTRIHPAHFREKVWHPARVRAGIAEKATPHSLRDSQVAWQVTRGTSLPVIQARLGHESIKTTIDVYGHLDAAVQRASVAAAEDALSGLSAAALPAAPAAAAATP